MNRRVSLLTSFAVTMRVLLPTDALSGEDFGVPQPLTDYGAADEGNDTGPSVATDGGGTWIVGWGSDDPGLGITGVRAPVISRSTDDGGTWSSPALLHVDFANVLASSPSLATSGGGKWIAAVGSGSAASVSLSNDNGLSWSVPQPLTSGANANYAARIATDGAGVWIVVWQSQDSLGGAIGSDEDILFSRSDDDGATWSPPAALNSDAATDARFDYDPHLATDSSGNWIVTWDSYDNALLARSTDGGATWGSPQAISTSVLAESVDTAISADGDGRWLAVWSYREDGNSGVRFSISSDNGATWSTEAVLHPYFESSSGEHGNPEAISLGGGEWQVVWYSTDALGGSLGANDADLLTSYSRNDGGTWSSPAALMTIARRDGGMDEFSAALARDSTGKTIVVFESGHTAAGVDYDIYVAAAERSCSSIAREDCLSSIDAGGSKLSIKDSPKGNDRLSWRLKRGQSTSDLQLGDPTTTDDYVLCLYEKVGGTPGLIAEWDAKAATTCRNQPCWTAVSGQIDYKDSGLEQGSIKKMRIRGGADGETSIRLAASGPALSPPRLPLDTTSPLRIQLVNLGTNTCWEGVHDQARKNDDVRFSSTSD